MEPDSQPLKTPHLYEGPSKESLKDILVPAVLVLSDQSIHIESAPSTPLYQISRDLTSISESQEGSSATFKRIDYNIPQNTKSQDPETSTTQHLFYLAHPANAQYRKDIPSYYITSVTTETLGNISFETSKPRFQKTQLTALLSAGRTMSEKPLFDEKAQSVLFHARPKWPSGGYRWAFPNGDQVAVEKIEGGQHKLDITTSLCREERDALVALWILRLWYDTAESRQAKREALEKLTPPEAVYSNMKFAKRAGALGGVAGGGGA